MLFYLRRAAVGFDFKECCMIKLAVKYTITNQLILILSLAKKSD